VSLYKVSLTNLIESLKRFPENKDIIEKLNLNFKYVPDPKVRKDVRFEGQLFHDFYVNAILDGKELDEDEDFPKFNKKKHIESFETATTSLKSKLENEKKKLAKKKLKKYYLNLLHNKSDVNFLKKEFAFTKLKYSRCPQYDSVSGGFAALFAGFIGFLISEKFGIELVDSGDFYIALVYGIFVGFILHMLTRLFGKNARYALPTSLNHNKTFFYEFVRFILARTRLHK
jgi:hypothetical protein